LLFLGQLESRLLDQSELCRNRSEEDKPAGRVLHALANTLFTVRLELESEWEPEKVWWKPWTWVR